MGVDKGLRPCCSSCKRCSRLHCPHFSFAVLVPKECKHDNNISPPPQLVLRFGLMEGGGFAIINDGGGGRTR